MRARRVMNDPRDCATSIRARMTEGSDYVIVGDDDNIYVAAGCGGGVYERPWEGETVHCRYRPARTEEIDIFVAAGCDIGHD